MVPVASREEEEGEAPWNRRMDGQRWVTLKRGVVGSDSKSVDPDDAPAVGVGQMETASGGRGGDRSLMEWRRGQRRARTTSSIEALAQRDKARESRRLNSVMSSTCHGMGGTVWWGRW
jgi:hypothetical protein